MNKYGLRWTQYNYFLRNTKKRSFFLNLFLARRTPTDFYLLRASSEVFGIFEEYDLLSTSLYLSEYLSYRDEISCESEGWRRPLEGRMATVPAPRPPSPRPVPRSGYKYGTSTSTACE